MSAKGAGAPAGTAAARPTAEGPATGGTATEAERSDAAAPPGDDVLDRFSPAASEWFRGAFHAPTTAQDGAWRAISSGDHTLVVAPTGSGKTLSAFLWALDRLASSPVPEEKELRCRVLYVSPLKALATDVERNLRAPLTGMRHAAMRLGLPVPEVSVALRSGDTPPQERRAFTRTPPDVLITTPESLVLLMTSKAREMLAGVQTVIVDEVHAVAGTKRGAHLALTLERLDAALPAPAQRIGLSATVRPVEDVARFLAGTRGVAGGGRRTTVVQPPSVKEWDLQVVVPVPDMEDLSTAPPRPGPPAGAAPTEPTRVDDDLAAVLAAAAPEPVTSIWPAVEERIVDLVAAHRSTIVFANSRRLAERLTNRLNEVWEERTRADEAAQADGSGGEEGAGRGDATATAASPLAVGAEHPGRPPAQVMAQAGTSAPVPAVIARAHHGSVSREQRALIEDDLKSGRLPAVVATSSLELGIDMGAVDLVVQVESPPSVASGLQRVGRAGHQVGAVSRGVMFPKFRGDLLSTAVVTERMRSGAIEALHAPASPLDVLAQHVVAMTAMDDWSVDDVEALVRRAAPFSGLTRGVLEAVLDMLAGRYPSEEFAELRPRIVWDRLASTLAGRPGAQRLAVTSGGTIPDRGLYGVFLAGSGGQVRGGRRVGELDEEMVYESRVGDVFTLGTSTWRIEDISHDQVLVSPAPGQPGKLPFWHGDSLGRPAELGRAQGAFVRTLGDLLTADEGAARQRARSAGLDDWAADNLLDHLREQRAVTGHLPDDRTIVVERFRDELGDWRVVVHSPFGAQVHAPWALAVGARLRERFGVDAQVMSADDGLVLRLPDTDLLGDPMAVLMADPFEALAGAGSGAGSGGPPGAGVAASGGAPAGVPEVLEALAVEPEDVEQLVTDELGGSALFAARFRECAARSLLLPRRRPDRRTPLWQQRQRAAQLLSVASRYPSFPIVLETVRECLQDVFDVPALAQLLREVRSGAVRVVEVTTDAPSPFARGLLFGYVAQFLYEGDTPLAEKRAAALSLDPTLLAELLGRGDGASLADLLDPEAIVRTQGELQRTADGRRCRDAEDVADLLRVLGPCSDAEVARRALSGAGGTEDLDEVRRWLGELVGARRVIAVRVAGVERFAAVEDAARLRDALGVPLPVGVPEAFTAPVPDPVGDLVVRWARTHAPFTAAAVAARYGVGVAVVSDALRRLESAGRVTSGDLLPAELRGRLAADGTVVTGTGTGGLAGGATSDGAPDEDAPRSGASGRPASTAVGLDWCDAEVLRLLRRRSLAALRSEVEPVTARDLALHLPAWQHVGAPGSPGGGRLRGEDGLVRAIEQLAGAQLPASALESLVLPARVEGYSPAMLDALTTSGEVLWCGHGALPGDDGWVSLHLADAWGPAGHLTLAPPDEELELGETHHAVLEALAGGGAFFFRALSSALSAAGRPVLDDARLSEVVWDLVFAGRVSNDTLAPLRARLSGGRTAHRGAKSQRSAPHARYGRSRPGRPTRPSSAGLGAAGISAAAARGGPPETAGRWSLLPTPEPDATVRAAATAEVLLDRYGVITRGSVVAEHLPGGFAGVYRVLAAMEEAGRVRRGYFVEGLGASQFATTGAVDRLRALSRPLEAASSASDGRWVGERTRGGGPPGEDAGRPGAAVGAGPAGDGPRRNALVLAAPDPANPYGAALPWPDQQGRPGDAEATTDAAPVRAGHRAGRKAGAVVVLVEGDLVLYVERGGRTVLSYTEDPELLRASAQALTAAVRGGALGRLTVSRADGENALERSVLAQALEGAGFVATPQGLRLRA